MEKDMLLQVRDLTKHYHVSRNGSGNKTVKAVDHVDLDIRKGETLGLVGESGCGKSTLGRLVLRLIEPTEGSIRMFDEDVEKYTRRQLKDFRKRAQMIFQNPYASLNPRMTVMESVRAPLDVHKTGSPKEREEMVMEVLEKVGLKREHAFRYPHEFSGGQRQRIFIARSLILEPDFIVCDEPVSSLDVSVRAQVINLLEEIQERLGVTYLFISHDLSVVKYISDRIAVMYLGHIVEIADKDALYDHPMHPYTRALLSAIPIPDVDSGRARILLKGDVPNPIDIPKGCCFHTRCPYAREACRHEVPKLRDVGSGRHVACHLCGDMDENYLQALKDKETVYSI